MRSCALRTLRPAIPSPLPKSTPPSSKRSAALPNITRSLRSATISRSSAPRALLPSSQTLAAINFSRRGTRSASSSSSSSNASMRRSRQAFSAPSKQTSDLNPKGDLNSIASISVSSTISTPWSEPSASKPRDLSLEREQNSRYRHDNGLKRNGFNRHRALVCLLAYDPFPRTGVRFPDHASGDSGIETALELREQLQDLIVGGPEGAAS